MAVAQFRASDRPTLQLASQPLRVATVEATPGRTAETFVAGRAVSEFQKFCCRKLVFEFYRRKGYLLPDAEAARKAGTYFDDETHTSLIGRRRGQVFHAKLTDGELVATSMFVKDTGQHVSKAAKNYGLPLDKTMPAELARLRAAAGPRAVFGEIGSVASTGVNENAHSVAVLRAIRRRDWSLSPLTAIFSQMYQHARQQGITDAVIGVHPTHKLFYEKLGFAEVASQRPQYVGLQGADVVLLHAKLEGLIFNPNSVQPTHRRA